jgi:hypothetical protein
MMLKSLLISVVAYSIGLHAQAIRVSSPSSEEPGTSDIVLVLETGDKKPPVAIQFEIHISARDFDLSKWTYSIGSAAQAAGKTLQCAGRWNKAPMTYIYTCVVAGQKSTIADGPILQATSPRSNDPKRHGGKISIEGAQCVDADLGQYSLKKSEWAYR